MARKTKTSKKAQENNESNGADTADAVDVDATDASPEAESDLTEPVSEAADTSTEADAETPVYETSDEAVDLASEETSSDEGDSETVPEDEEADAVDTTVAGVVPAQPEDSAPSPSASTIPPPPPAATPSAVPLIFGGLIAGAAGFLVATFAVPEGWPNRTPAALEVPVPDVETVARVDTLTSDLAAVTERLDALSAGGGDTIVNETVDLTPVLERLDAIEDETRGLGEALATLEKSAADLSARIDEVADQPAIVSPDGSAAMEAQLETFRRDLDAVTEAARAEIEEAQARASQIEVDAAMAAAAAARSAALSEVRAALESGEPFADSLGALGDVPDALASVAADGVTPIAALQDSFPDAARSALQDVQTVPEDASVTDRMASFLRRHTNARSLAPRDGDDPDAVLSRAEAALSSGDVPAALTELEALPDGASEALQGWIDDARARAAAVAAMNEME